MLWNRRVYFDNSTGDIITTTGGFEGGDVRYTIDYEFEIYSSLKDRSRDSVGVIDLDIGQYEQDFIESDEYRVNLETKTIEFSYPDPSQPDAPPVFRKPLTERIVELESQNTELMLAVAELASAGETDKIETQLAIAELATLVTGGTA
ncbi:hypothetical protein K7T73_12380 [Bacillus badius]|uniref:hypothetical protein n=1 Tax=Bacillus badius TaxID=1455 RepID=UPI001CBFF01B|nr:hypothetical protein [Bacillus badius]UAT29397.1 hypothetical protein K7T73_12380 [Bacillus badius]